MKNNNIDKFKEREAFKVPENYFNTLSDRIMSNLPEQETHIEEPLIETPVISMWSRMKPFTYLAAMIIGALLIIRIALPGDNGVTDEFTEHFDIEEVSDQFIYETIDGAMLDDYTLHLYLTENGE